MPDLTSRLGALADAAAVALRMMSGQFPDEVLDPVLRELEEKYGVVLDRDALRARLEQGIGFADYGKYARQQFLEGLRRLERDRLRIYTDKGILVPTADLAAVNSSQVNITRRASATRRVNQRSQLF